MGSDLVKMTGPVSPAAVHEWLLRGRQNGNMNYRCVGPQIGRKYRGVDTGTSFGVAFALDLMFWPTKNIGWYISPEFGYGIGKSNGERSIGASVGIEFGL